MASSPTSIKSDDGQIPIPRGYSKRGDGFSVQETEGLLTEIRERWQEGWDVIAEVHNTQFPGHKRTAGSLKRKFAKLYRTKIDVTTKEKHARAAVMAKKVRDEMRVQRRGLAPAARGLADDLIGDTDTAVGVQEVHEDLSEVEIIGSQPATQPQSLTEAPVTPNEQDLRQTLAPGVPLTQGMPDAWQAAMNRWPIAGESLRRLRSRAASGETVDTQDLAQTMLMVLLDSQHQRDVERDQEREERRLEKQQWQEEMREQQRRHEQERIEDRRRNEQFMQVMTTLVAQIAAGQQRGGLN